MGLARTAPIQHIEQVAEVDWLGQVILESHGKGRVDLFRQGVRRESHQTDARGRRVECGERL